VINCEKPTPVCTVIICRLDRPRESTPGNWDLTLARIDLSPSSTNLVFVQRPQSALIPNSPMSPRPQHSLISAKHAAAIDDLGHCSERVQTNPVMLWTRPVHR
jgi:hypothetical protein